jgi:tetratricopeptide (TPR) repeat protein
MILASLGIYFYRLYPCSSPNLAQIKLAADNYIASRQWSFVEEKGIQLCDCGDLGEGWDLRAKYKYHNEDYRSAAEFWKSASDYDKTSDPYRANLAAAYVQIKDYPAAVKIYGQLVGNKPSSLHFRYGLGRALVYNGQFKDALDHLRTVPTTFDDGGSNGQARIMEAAAHYGYYTTLPTDDLRREQELNSARQSLCEGLGVSGFDWNTVIKSDTATDIFSVIRSILRHIYPPPNCPAAK